MMVTGIDREELLRHIDQGGQVVDVLPEPEYRQQHLPGAVNIPLRRLDAETTSALRRDKPVMVYCHDGL
jgi:rhodanese-related sulfurtransferase